MANGPVFSIGHGNLTRATLLEQLKGEHVSFLVDVRSVPYSRFQPEFARESLEGFLRDHEVRYVYMGNLLGGRPQDEDCYTDGRVDYEKIRSKDFFLRGISRLRTAVTQGLRVCLLCSESQPAQCHRAKLVGVALASEGINVTHMLSDGSRRSQAEVIAELTGGQGNLFPEGFVSRKTYR